MPRIPGEARSADGSRILRSCSHQRVKICSLSAQIFTTSFAARHTNAPWSDTRIRGRWCLTYLPTLTACWNVGRFWNGYTLGLVTPAVTRARLAFQHDGCGSVVQAPKA